MRAFFLSLVVLLAGVDNREARRFRYSWEQGYDDSCGLQVAACLLGLYWGLAADEEGLARECRGEGRLPFDPEISLGDLRLILRRRGFEAEGFELDYEALVRASSLYAPIVVHCSMPRGHFLLLLGADNESVVLADPAAGLVLSTRRDFEARWSGCVLLALLPGSQADALILAEANAEARASREQLCRAAAWMRRVGR